MLKIENVGVYGWDAAIRGMRNPKNSWDKSDTVYDVGLSIGDNDLKLMKTLSNAGDDHGKFLRYITVTFDITAPLYWWKEYDTYKVGTVADSCSTMHKIHDKEFSREDFSHEELTSKPFRFPYTCDTVYAHTVLGKTIRMLNMLRDKYNETGEKEYWYSMIQLLPSSYNQKRTVLVNYQVLKHMYHARKNHKLNEWHTFCDWIETLPYSELITGGESDGQTT